MHAEPRIYVYKLTVDNGGAPCVQDGLLTLAICKPMIRRMAVTGDLIFGFAANSLHPDNPLLYIACVDEKLSGDAYYCQERFADRGDCIYELQRGPLPVPPGSPISRARGGSSPRPRRAS